MDLRYCRVGHVKIHRTDRDRRPIECDRIDLPPSPEEPMLTAGAAKTVPEPNDQASSVADPAMDDPLKFKLLRGPSGLSPTKRSIVVVVIIGAAGLENRPRL